MLHVEGHSWTDAVQGLHVRCQYDAGSACCCLRLLQSRAVQTDCCQRLLLTECHPGLQGDKVKFTLQFRGREMQYKEDGQQMLQVRAVCTPTGASAGVAQSHDC